MIPYITLATILYIVANLLIGFWRLRSTDYASFVSSKGTFGWLALTLSLAGTVVGGGMFFAVGQMGFEAGIAVLALPVSYILGYMILGVAIPHLRRLLSECDGNTLYDVLQYRLNSDDRRTSVYVWLISAVTFAMYFFMFAGQFSILATFYISVVGVSRTVAWAVALGVVGSATIVYSVAGGLKKDILTDILQVIVVLVGSIVACFFLCREPIAAFTNVPENHFNMMGYGIAFPIGVLLFFSPAFVGRFDYWQRVIAARDARQAKLSLWGSLPFVFFAYVVFAMLGIYARSQNPDILPANAAIWALRHLLPGTSFLVVVIALYAAVMSTSDTLLNVSTVSLHHLVCSTLKIERRLPLARLLAVVVSVLASLTVLVAADFVDLIVGGFSSLVILTPSVLYILLAKRPAHLAAILSVAIGYTCFLAIFVLVEGLRKYAFMPGFLIAGVPIVFTALIPRKSK